MPALYALAQHDALASASDKLLPSQHLFSFLDDLYIVTTKARAATVFKEVATAVERHAGVQSHAGKLRAWCRGGGAPPEDLQAISAEAWTADKPPEANGIVILGTPLGTTAFAEAHSQKRMVTENCMLEELPLMQNPQVAWVLLSQSAVAGANHTLRVVPPSASASYAASHDQAVWQVSIGTMAAHVLWLLSQAVLVALDCGLRGGLQRQPSGLHGWTHCECWPASRHN